MIIRLAQDIEHDSIVDGEGLRTVIWMQGCSHNCKSCHNPQTHSFTDGNPVDMEYVKQKILESKNDGITLSGGDPMFQIKQSLEIARFCQKNSINVWCYTGFTFEKLVEMSEKNCELYEFLINIDVLIDGKYEEKLRSFDLKYRGSSNQRIIECKKSITNNQLIYHDLRKESFNPNNLKSNYIYI